MDNKMLREAAYFPSPALLAPMELCFMNPEEKRIVANAIEKQLEQLRLMFREQGLRNVAKPAVLEYFTERLCIPSAARPLFLSRLELVEIYQPTFNFVNEFFEANKSELVQGLVEEGVSTILSGRVPAVPPSLIAIESFLQEILIKPEEFLQKVKSRPKKSRNHSRSSFSFTQEYNMIKNLVVKYLERVLKEGNASYNEAREVFKSQTEKTFREKLIAFLQTEQLIMKIRLLKEFFLKIMKMDSTIPLRKTQAEERRRTAAENDNWTRNEEQEYFAGLAYRNRRATPEKAQSRPQIQRGRREYSLQKREGVDTLVGKISRPTTNILPTNLYDHPHIGIRIDVVNPMATRLSRPLTGDPPDALDEAQIQSIKAKQRKTESAAFPPRQQMPSTKVPLAKGYSDKYKKR